MLPKSSATSSRKRNGQKTAALFRTTPSVTFHESVRTIHRGSFWSRNHGQQMENRPHLYLLYVPRHARGAGSSRQGGLSRAAREAGKTPCPPDRHRPALGRHQGASGE